MAVRRCESGSEGAVDMRIGTVAAPERGRGRNSPPRTVIFMSDLQNPEVQALLSAPNYGVISTHDSDGTILSTVVWVGYTDGELSVNSALGRRWPTNLENDPRATLVVYNPENPYSFVEVRATAQPTTEGAFEHIDALAKKYLNQDKYPFLQPGEQRVKLVLRPERVRFVKQ